MSGFLSGRKKNNQEPEAAPVKDIYGDLKRQLHLSAARMKPHYLGNVASTIYYLCDSDVERAQETILAFSGYLRQNVEALERKELMPFPWELEHVQNYITLEKLRFEDRLNLKYEIDVDDFELPPLSLQPLVENSVKHGLAKLNRPVTISVLTRRTVDGGVQIKVIDDGAGFDPKTLTESEDEPKSIECIRKRLQSEVGGDLTIESKPDEGTMVVITLKPGSRK